MAFVGFLLLGLGASGLASRELWLSGHEPPFPVWVSHQRPLAWRAGTRGWVAGRAGLWGALATWVGVSSSSPQVPGHPGIK